MFFSADDEDQDFLSTGGGCVHSSDKLHLFNMIHTSGGGNN